MGAIDSHLGFALGIVKSAKAKLNGQNQNNNDGGGIGGWLKDKAQSGFNAAQNGWQNLPSKDFIEDPLVNARNTVVNGAVDGWNNLPGNEFVEDKIGDLTDKMPFNNIIGASVRALGIRRK